MRSSDLPYDVAYYFGYKLPSLQPGQCTGGPRGHGNWDADLFVDNLTNKVALVSANNTSFQFNIPQVVRYSTNQHAHGRPAIELQILSARRDEADHPGPRLQRIRWLKLTP